MLANAYQNGPTTVEVQGRWIVDCIRKMEREGLKYIDPEPEAVKEWKKKINDLSNATLFPTTRSTYMGGKSYFFTRCSHSFLMKWYREYSWKSIRTGQLCWGHSGVCH